MQDITTDLNYYNNILQINYKRIEEDLFEEMFVL